MKKFVEIAKVFSLVLVVLMFGSSISQAAKLDITPEYLAQITQEITAVTGLQFKSIPEVVYASNASINRIINDELKILQVSKPNTIGSLDLKDLGLIKTNLFGKYSWKTGKIYLNLDEINSLAAKIKTDHLTTEIFILTHELVHALDDQHFNLKEFFTLISTEDGIMTLGSMVEGHADLVAYEVYKRLDVDEEAIDEFRETFERAGSIYGPLYKKTREFISQVLKSGELTITDIFTHPPQNSETLFYPNEYIAGKLVEQKTISQYFGTPFLEELPWYFEKICRLSGTKGNMLLEMGMNGGTEEDMQGYVTSVDYICMGKTKSKPKNYGTLSPYGLSLGTLLKFTGGALRVSVSEFATETDADNYADYIDQHFDELMFLAEKDQDAGFEGVAEKYPLTFISQVSMKTLGKIVHLSTVLNSRYTVEVYAFNLGVTEDQLIQILDSIAKRMVSIDQ